MACPELFMDKYNCYKEVEDIKRKRCRNKQCRRKEWQEKNIKKIVV